MVPNRDEQWAQTTKRRSEKLLASLCGGAVRLDEGASLQDRAHVRRFRVLDAPTGAPASVVAKEARVFDGQVYKRLLFEDWAGLAFLSGVAGDDTLAPRFYAGDRDVGLFLMEDLGDGGSPDRVLLGTDPVAAEETLVSLARQLGRLHARTIGNEAQFDQIRDALGSGDDRDERNYQWLATGFQDLASVLDVHPSAQADEELAQVIVALTEPGPFLAYTHGDPCPDNWQFVDGRLRLFDFERGAFRHALLDGVYGRIHFPTCWCVNRLPAQIPARMESAYREELARGCPEAGDDDRFSEAVVATCAAWALRTYFRNDFRELLEQDRQWGIASVRQRVLLRSDIVARLTQERGYLQALGDTLSEIAEKLRRLWPADADAMPYYPAFR